MYENDYCLYKLDGAESTNPSTHCDATIQNEDNSVLFGVKSTTFILYFVYKIIFALCLTPVWSIADAIAVKVCQEIDVDWAVISFFGSLSSIAAPLILGKGQGR